MWATWRHLSAASLTGAIKCPHWLGGGGPSSGPRFLEVPHPWLRPQVTGLQLLDGQQEVPVNTVLPQHPQRFFKRNPAIYFSQVDKTCVDVFGMVPGFSKISWRVEICSVVLRPRRKQRWVSSCFGSVIFAAPWHTLFLGGWAMVCRGSWFIHSCLHF